MAATKTPGRVAREAYTLVQRYGPACAAAHGISVPKQFAQLYWLGMVRGLTGDAYYRYWLFRPERFRSAQHYLQWHECAMLYRVIAVREATDDFAVLEDKHRFAAWCREQRLPTVPVLGEFRDGAAYPADSERLLIPDQDVFSKPSNQYGGVGTRLWRYVPDRRWVDEHTGASHSHETMLATLAEQSKAGPLILQPRLVNDASLRPFASMALCTLRLVTARRPDADPELVAAAFRTGAGRSPSDNFSDGGIAVAVEPTTGRLRHGIRRDQQTLVAEVRRHPDTGVEFHGFRLPKWEEAVTLALTAHRRLRAMPFVGWDIAFTPDGLVLLEGNFNPGVSIVQAGWGVPLGETVYPRYLDAHLRRSFAR
ncbi:MAG TPA: sugar-transfer associated ATP-grasp domain-containing protein [Gemmatimonadaceae bacterium]|nr:sugar-transfer associated ATP-grasp domain-containing protein [Gemmatimonadaceae bacterium]